MIDGDRLPTLTGPRVRLRWLEERDVAALFEVFSDPEVMRYWSRTPHESEAESAAILTRARVSFAEKSAFQWGVARLADDRVIGTCSLWHLDASNARGDVGYALGRAHWGQGLMGEALSLLLRFAFEELSLRRLEADVDPGNAASIRSLERLGFQREGLLRERWCVGGEVQDSLVFGLLRREWAAARKKAEAAR
jgi:ribosomal-protein-alanine N-acetyltransferase